MPARRIEDAPSPINIIFNWTALLNRAETSK
jgi:hypothetical protein